MENRDRALTEVRRVIEEGRRQAEALVADGKATQQQLDARMAQYEAAFGVLSAKGEAWWTAQASVGAYGLVENLVEGPIAESWDASQLLRAAARGTL